MPPNPETTGTPAQSRTGGARPVPSLAELSRRITEISSIPAVALRVMEIASNTDSTGRDLEAAVEADPSLAVRVLRCVNSAAFGLRSEVTDLGRAISLLGFNQIRDFAISACISDLFRSTKRIGDYDRKKLWTHFIATAVCARGIAVRAEVEGHDDAFLSGLLHDIGIILFDQHCHEEFRRVLGCLTSEKTLAETEKGLLGWDHTELGHMMGRQWKLPARTLTSIRWHHEPERYTGPDAGVLHCVALANFLCSLRGMTSVGRNLVRLPQASLDGLGFETGDLAGLAERLEGELEANRHLFDIQGA